MLVLSRRPNESIMIGDNVEIKIVEVKGDYVKLGINAPRHISIHRKEIYEAIQRENMEAAQNKMIDLDTLGTFLDADTHEKKKHDKDKNQEK